MKTIDRRLRRLEERFVPREEGESPLIALLRTREKRCAELEGRPYIDDDGPREDTRGMTIAEVLRLQYRHRDYPSNDGSLEGVTLVQSAKAPTEA